MKTDALLLPRATARSRRSRCATPCSGRRPGARPQWNRVAFAAAHVVADPRAAIDPWLDVGARLGRDARLSPPSLVAGLRRRRSDGHRAARHGPRLADVARADPAQRRRRRARRRARSSSAAPAPIIWRPMRDRHDRRVIAAYEEQCAAVEATGGRIILMASRALAACARSPDDYARVYDRVLSQVRAAGDPALARRHVRSGARRLLGRRAAARDPDHARAMDVCAARHRGERGEGRRHQDLAARRPQGDRDARPAARRRAHVHRRRFQLRRADRRRRERALRRAARHLRRDRAGRVGGADRARRAATARASTRSSRRRCRCRATSSRRRRASTRPASCSWRGSTATSRISRWSAASRARAASCTSRELVPARRRRRPARDPGLAATRLRALLAHARRRVMAAPDPALLSLNTATVREQWTLPQIIDGCARHGIRGISPWRDQVAKPVSTRPRARIRDAGLHGQRLLPRRHVPGGRSRGPARRARRQPPRGRRGARRSARAASCWSSAACRRIANGRARLEGPDRARARWCATASAQLLDYARPAGMPLAIEPLHPMYAADRACVNTLAQALDLCDELSPD